MFQPMCFFRGIEGYENGVHLLNTPFGSLKCLIILLIDGTDNNLMKMVFNGILPAFPDDKSYLFAF